MHRWRPALAGGQQARHAAHGAEREELPTGHRRWRSGVRMMMGRVHGVNASFHRLLPSVPVPAVVQGEPVGSKISMTLDTYSHVLPMIQKDGMGGLDDFFNE